MQNSTFKTFDGLDIYYSYWKEVKNPKGIIQIIHGMAEHSGRYDDFAMYLNSIGYIVYATDHREHGRTAKKIEDIGYVNDNDIFHMVKDEQLFTLLIKDQYKDLPFFILGHSMGSFILQKYLQHMGIVALMGTDSKVHIKGTIIMGSAFRSFEYYLAQFISLCFLKIFGDKRIKLLEKIFFNKFRLNFISKVASSFISTEEKEVKRYEEDPYCAMTFSTKFYYELFTFMIDVFKRYNMELIDLDIPLFIVSGKKDPVGGKSKKIEKLYAEYQYLGDRDVSMKIYTNSLHEIIHDKEKKQVYNDIKEWLNKRC